jgi:hypothetical protein
MNHPTTRITQASAARRPGRRVCAPGAVTRRMVQLLLPLGPPADPATPPASAHHEGLNPDERWHRVLVLKAFLRPTARAFWSAAEVEEGGGR